MGNLWWYPRKFTRSLRNGLVNVIPSGLLRHSRRFCNGIGSNSQFCTRMRQMLRLYGDEYRLKHILSDHIAL